MALLHKVGREDYPFTTCRQRFISECRGDRPLEIVTEDGSTAEEKGMKIKEIN